MKKLLLKTWLLLACLLLGVGTTWGAIETSTYTLCTSTDDLVAGAHYIIASGTSGSVNCISNVENANNRKIVSATVTDSKIEVASNSTIMTLTLGGSTGAWTFSTDNYAGTNGYLASAASGNNNYCRVISTSTTSTISISDNAAVITLQPHTSRNILRFNSSSSCFACYSTGQAAVYLYKKTNGGGTPPPTNAAPTITSHPANATYTLNATAKALTIVATGTPTPTYKWYSNTTNSNENGTELEGATTASYTPSTATAGIFYYYCVATNSEGSAKSNVATITINEPTPATLPFEFDGGKSDISGTQGMSQSGLGSDYSSSPKLKFDSQGDNVIINFNEAAKKVTYTIKGNSTSGTYAFDLMESADGVNYTTVHSHTSITDATSYTDNLKAESRFVKFVYTTKDNGNVALGKISIVAASALDDPELAFAQPTYIFFTDDDMQVVATSSAGSTGAITYALTEGDADAFLIDESTGDIVCETTGTYTVTATIAAATGFTSGTATCTVKIKEPVVGNSIIVAEAGGSYYAMTTTCDGSYFGYQAIKKAGDKYVAGSLDEILFYTNTADGKTTIQSTSNTQYVQATGEKKISYTENEYKWANDGEKLTAATASNGTLQYNTSSPRFTTYGSKVGQYATIVDLSNVIVGEIVTLNSACTDENFVYGTYSSSKAWVVPSDLEVSEISIVDDALYVESYASGAVVPANTGVMVSAEDGGSYAVAFSNEAGTSVLGTENCLHPSSEPMTGDNLFYRLTMHNGTQIGFWWGAEDGAAFSLAANKAYLAVPTSSSARTGLWFGDDEEALEAVEMNAATTIYTLNGVKVNELQKGLNIVNGKKVMVK